MTEPAIRLSFETRAEGRVARITLDNPARLNCLGSVLLEDFARKVNGLAQEPDVRVLVVTGAGRAFAGGADIAEMGALAGPDAARAFILRVHLACEAVRALPIPVIARVNGFCLGAGMELAAACDLRVAAQTAVFGMPEVKLGLPSVVEAALLPALVGYGRTREMLLTGETFDAEAALRFGLVEKVAAPEDLDGAVEAWVASLLAAKPRALALQKALIRRWEALPMAEAVAAGVEAFAAAFETDEPVRAIADFQAARRAAKAVG